MISNNSSTKGKNNSKKLLLHSLQMYWWLAVICSVVYCFAGPVYTLLKIDSIRRPSNINYLSSATEESLLSQQLERMSDWMNAEGCMMLYFSVVVLSAVIGCVMFFYLQQKRQVNFYHSQPVTRTRLFINQYVVGLLLNLVPFMIMLVLMLLLIAGYGLGTSLNMTAILAHGGMMLLFSLASYSIAVLSGQLAGTALTQIALNGVLHFCVPLAAWLMQLLCNLFLATYSGAFDFVQTALKFSPLCAAVLYIDNIPSAVLMNRTTMSVPPMNMGLVLTQLALIVLLTVLSWFLYQKRASEAAGKALVYRVSEPLLKAYLMFVISIAAGLVFMAVGSKLFFYFAVVVFAILTHMTCEVIIQHDFKAMGKRLPQCAVIVVLILAIVGVLRYDVLGYDMYLPKPEQVERVSLVVDSSENSSWLGYDIDGEISFSHDDGVKQQVHALLEPIVTEKNYRASSFNGSIVVDGSGNYSSVRVYYELKNGKKAARQYRAVPTNALEENYRELYNLSAYREMLYRNVLQTSPETVKEVWVNDVLAEDAKVLLQAYQQDLRERNFEALTKGELARIGLSSGQRDGRWQNNVIYESDKRTAALLTETQLKAEQRGIDYYDYDEILIFRCESTERRMIDEIDRKLFSIETTEDADTMIAETRTESASAKESGELSAKDCIQRLEGLAQLAGRIEGTDAVAAFCRQTNLHSSGGDFVHYDDSHFALLHYVDVYNDGWQIRRLYEDTLPAQYQ